MCEPTDNTSSYSDSPPLVNYSTKPVVRQTSELFINTPQPGPSSGHHSTIHELGVNYPNTSSVLTQNSSVNSNIHELGINSNIGNSVVIEKNLSTQNVHELAINSPRSSLKVNTSDATISNISPNSSTLAQRGGDSSVGSLNVHNRWNADDYSNVYDNLGNTQSHLYTEYVIPKEGTFDRIKLGLKHLNSKVGSFESKVDSIYVKYHDIGKRKFFWTIWEKN